MFFYDVFICYHKLALYFYKYMHKCQMEKNETRLVMVTLCKL